MFIRSELSPVTSFNPYLTADDAHAWLLVQLQNCGAPFGDFTVSNAVKGNVGEAIAMFLGSAHDFAGWQCVPVNATDPFSAISRPGIDLVWILRDPLTVILQEVKTSSDPDLAVADGLVTDYARLFGDDVRLTLHTRLQYVANIYHYTALDLDLADGVRGLAGANPATTHGVAIVPTLIEPGNSPKARTKLIAVRTSLVQQGWDEVAPWSVAFPDLDNRISRLCRGL